MAEWIALQFHVFGFLSLPLAYVLAVVHASMRAHWAGARWPRILGLLLQIGTVPAVGWLAGVPGLRVFSFGWSAPAVWLLFYVGPAIMLAFTDSEKLAGVAASVRRAASCVTVGAVLFGLGVLMRGTEALQM